MKHEPETIQHLIEWLETKNPYNSYNYQMPRDCMAAQYKRSIGRNYTPVPFNLGKDVIGYWNFPKFDIALEEIAFGSPRTFGAALERAKERADAV